VKVVVDGPYFEEPLHVGLCCAGPPVVTLMEGLASTHQAVVGGRLPLATAQNLPRRVLWDGVLAASNLVWDVAIGQSSLATHTVVANLFHRGVAILRAPRIGGSLRTMMRVVGLRQSSRLPGRAATGLAARLIAMGDHHGRPVLDLWRCAMPPLRDDDRQTGFCDDPTAIGKLPAYDALAAVIAQWHLEVCRAARPGLHLGDIRAGDGYVVAAGGVESCAPEAARLTVNIARVQRDASTLGARLVYGGHTIGLALRQALRALPNLLTVVASHGSEYLAHGP
jgi:acyl dehydratase